MTLGRFIKFLVAWVIGCALCMWGSKLMAQPPNIPLYAAFSSTPPAPPIGTDPSTLPNKIVLYDPTRIPGITVGSTIGGTLNDFSGNAFNAISSSFPVGPYATNNASQLRATNFWMVFDGSSQRYTTNFAVQNQPITFYMLARQRSLSSIQFYYDAFSIAANRELCELSSASLVIASSQSLVGDPILSQWYWIEGQFNGNPNSLMRTNNVLMTSGDAGTTAWGGISIGGKGDGTVFGNLDLAYFVALQAAEASGVSTSVYQWATNRFGPAF